MSKEAPAIVIGDDLGVDPSAPPPLFVDFSPTEYFVEQFGTEEAARQLENFVRDSTVRHLGKAAQAPKQNVVIGSSESSFPASAELKDPPFCCPSCRMQEYVVLGVGGFLLATFLLYLVTRK